MKKINVGVAFARYPAGRYRTDGPHSGQRFREEFLVPVLNEQAGIIEIDLTLARGLKSSFLEEAFGGLVRAGFDATQLVKRFTFVSQDATIGEEILDYIRRQGELESNRET